MTRQIYLYNTLSRRRELFTPVHPNMVGIYVCGPTVYSEPHLGHARPGITYDVLVRMFRYFGYKVRYVRNITDVGHLEHDADEGDDKIAKKARLEQLEPMEIVQKYTISFHDAMRKLNTQPPSIEPRASGHIIEQIDLIKKIIDAGYAYISNGSVYFDVKAYDQKFNYGELSGRNIEEMIANTRELDGQSDKKSSFDFALWKKASPEHIMKWPSPWSEGFPGWHLECSAMSAKYLGDVFDIHGGGLDLQFPHHECEMAQNRASRGKSGVNYWIHNNLITINGQKMGKSLGNFITIDELFSGSHKLLDQPYSPMTIRFFILQAHYRSTLDFSNEALKGAEKGLKRIIQAGKDISSLQESKNAPENKEINGLLNKILDALCDDMNTPIALSFIFEGVKYINLIKEGSIKVNASDLDILKEIFNNIVPNVLGLIDESTQSGSADMVDGVVEMVLDIRKVAKSNKDFATSDLIRDKLKELGIQIKDTKDGVEWSRD
jgi:cysteinyl-tRNA synthetase